MRHKRVFFIIPIVLFAMLIIVPVAMAKPTMSVLWALSGNSGTDPATDFIGTTDGADLAIQPLVGNVGIGTTSPNEKLEITGNFRLPKSTLTDGVIKSDGNRYIHNFGTSNFFAGVNAGNLTMTGDGRNTGVGFNALNSNISGDQNTAVGSQALSIPTPPEMTTWRLARKRYLSTPLETSTWLLDQPRSLPTMEMTTRLLE